MKIRARDFQKGVRAYGAENYATAHRLLLRFAEEGDAEAQTMIGSIYQLGLGGFRVNEDEAAKWYLLASEKGNGLASNNLGTMAFLRGNREEAIRYFQTARNQGFLHTPLVPAKSP
ncbi:MAG: sel1 repeat family protein [Candidatus Binataceae bacterium]|jgi:TPR repeat protein